MSLVKVTLIKYCVNNSSKHHVKVENDSPRYISPQYYALPRIKSK